ncbi:MAG: OmpH family outer membrane protein [Prevotella sp.]|mgnify:CR=1 FL=1|jgi:outer membrane protein|nr:OmpH family outer membrane protein [Prevotella sp.]MDY4625462.1 OmpH family outer membrane protein [Prevotella sp.]MDY5259459.1 OmpH family outer membrane protein [Prevotella sp.]
MKKSFKTAALAVVAAMSLVACNNQPKQNDTAEKPVQDSEQVGGQKIAYVEVDSISSQYQFSKDIEKLLNAKNANISKTLSAKQQALQQAYNNFMQNARANKYTQEQAQQLQAGIQQQANEGQELEQRLKNEFAQEQAKYQKAFNDSVEHFIQAYNKDKKYSYILMKGGMVNTILYADKAYDITNDVVKGLNKAYTGMKKK